MKMKLREALLRLIYPRRAECLGCGDRAGFERDDLCESCRELLARNRLGPEMPPKRSGLDAMAFAYIYVGPAGGLVRSLKYRGVGHLAEPMGAEIARAVRALRLNRVDCVTAVPMHPARRRRRGANQSELLARRAAEVLGCPYRELLRRTRNTVQQARLGADERRKNLKDAFCAEERLDGLRVLLIDDVYTTGTTAGECAAVLRAAGAERVYFAAFARGVQGKKKRAARMGGASGGDGRKLWRRSAAPKTR